MSFAFKTPPAKPAFGEFREPLDAGEYILKKKALTTFCNSAQCTKGPPVSSQGEMLLLNEAKLQKANNYTQFNKYNLNSNLITTLDLSGCCTVQSNPMLPDVPRCSISIPPPNSSEPFYINYTIDPNGCLFGQTLCGANNYLKWRIYTIPPSTTPQST